MRNSIIKIISGLLAISTAVLGYIDYWEYLHELTFLSNLLCGIVVLTDGLFGLTLKKRVPVLIYQMPVLCISVVFFTSLLSLLGPHPFRFSGAFFFLHGVNPPVILAIYLFCGKLPDKGKRDYALHIFASPLLIMGYLLFDYIRYTATGYFIYGLIPTEYVNTGSVVLIGAIFYVLMVFLSWCFLRLKRLLQKKEINRFRR